MSGEVMVELSLALILEGTLLAVLSVACLWILPFKCRMTELIVGLTGFALVTAGIAAAMMTIS